MIFKNQNWQFLIKYIFICVIIAWFIKSFIHNTIDYEWSALTFPIPLVLLCLSLHLINVLFQITVWRYLVNFDQQNKVTWWNAYRIYGLSSFSRYLPAGKALQFLSVAYLTERHDLKMRSVGAYGTTMLLGWMAGLLIMAATVHIVVPEFPTWTGLLFCIFLLVSIFSLARADRLLSFIAKFHPKLAEIDKIIPKLKTHTIVAAVLLTLTLSWLPEGASGYFVAKMVSDKIELNQFLPIIAYVTYASFAGYLAFFSPGGLGVRELTLAAFLQKYMNAGDAYIISIVLRILFTLSEGILLIPLGWVWTSRQIQKLRSTNV